MLTIYIISKYDNTKVGNGQCVALIKQYETDVLGLTPEAVGNAHQYFDDFENQPFLYNNFQKIPFQNNLPIEGDIIVWNTNVGSGAGHVAIAFNNINEETFNSFDQNWNTPLLCSLETHTYNNVVGWLRPNANITKKSNKKWLLARNKKILIYT